MLGENDKVTISKLFVFVVVSIFSFVKFVSENLRSLIVVVSFFLTADFGLAKQKNPDASKMTSMVGTILYSWYVYISLCLFT